MRKKIVLAISGSLRKPSFTERVLDIFIEGMGENVDLKKFYPHKMDIKPCNSCWSCWGEKNPGVCVHKDDFLEILDVYKQADYFLIATPLYFFSFPATVKNVIDRFFIVLEPAQNKSLHGGTEHPKRFDCHPKTVLISSCGFPEIENFSILHMHFNKICNELEWPSGGEILISAAGAAKIPKLFDEKYKHIRKAGTELSSGRVTEETMAKISAPVISDEDYRQLSTANFSGGIKAKMKMVSVAMKTIRGSKNKIK